MKRNSKGETVLHTAAIRGSLFLVEQLLTMGANPNVQVILMAHNNKTQKIYFNMKISEKFGLITNNMIIFRTMQNGVPFMKRAIEENGLLLKFFWNTELTLILEALTKIRLCMMPQEMVI